MNKVINKQTKTKKARELRKNMTDAEKKLWRYLRRKNIADSRFRRQHPIGNYIVDFVCIEKNLVIEVDGGQHSDRENYDVNRTRFLNNKGYKVLRFWNNEVLNDISAVLNIIYKELE